ncbi:MAG: FKBP-type peptidyl-prolyl cis-trans isomerase, partial [Burkholderiales bacterium]
MASTTSESGLKIEEVLEGSGAAAAAGQRVTVHYTGWLT